MPLVTFSPNTKIKSAEVNANLVGLADGSLDVTKNSLEYFRRKSMANHVITGLTIPTSVSLSSNIAAGEAIINGKYAAPTLTAKTFTASKDTYVDLKDDGVYAFVEVANGATTGMTLTLNSDGSDALRIAKVVTSATAITSVAINGFDSLGNVLRNLAPFGYTKVVFPTLLNGWVTYDTIHQQPHYAIDKAGIVHFGGMIKNGTLGLNIFVLGASYRPNLVLHFAGVTNGVFGYCRVDSNGDVAINSGANSWWSIDNVSYKAYQ